MVRCETSYGASKNFLWHVEILSKKKASTRWGGGWYILCKMNYFVSEWAYCTNCIICRALSNLMSFSSMYFSRASLWSE